jgi:hypothetical protein
MEIVRNLSKIIKIQYCNQYKDPVYINDDKLVIYPISNPVVMEWLSMNGKILKVTKPNIKEVLSLKLRNLDDYYHSNQVRKVNIKINNKSYQIVNSSLVREVFSRRLIALESQIKNNILTKERASFLYVISDSQTEIISLKELKEKLFTLEEKRQSQFYNKERHKKEILSLQTESEIENYNFKTGW